MFKKLIQYFKTQNEIMEKLLIKLSDTNSWTKEGIMYKFKDSSLVLQWGHSGSFDSVTTHREIREPQYMSIPHRFRRKVNALIKKIDDRENGNVNAMSFLNQYLSGEYCYYQQIVRDQLSERTMWMINEGITEYNIIGVKIWFKNESDAMAYKLRWM